ncbi:hypothetical protein [Pyrobaculum aerophilum]
MTLVAEKPQHMMSSTTYNATDQRLAPITNKSQLGAHRKIKSDAVPPAA